MLLEFPVWHNSIESKPCFSELNGHIIFDIYFFDSFKVCSLKFVGELSHINYLSYIHKPILMLEVEYDHFHSLKLRLTAKDLYQYPNFFDRQFLKE